MTSHMFIQEVPRSLFSSAGGFQFRSLAFHQSAGIQPALP